MQTTGPTIYRALQPILEPFLEYGRGMRYWNDPDHFAPPGPLLMMAATGLDESSPSYRGWRVVGACFLTAFFIFGFGLYGQGVYLAELQRAYGWQGSFISTASTLSFLISSVLVVFTRDVLAWIGLRPLVLSGISSLAASTTLLALMSEPCQLYIAYILMALAWTGMGTVVIATVLNSWFDRRRGLAISLAFNGATCGGIVLAPALLALVGAVGFKGAMLAATAFMAIVLIPLAVGVIGWPVPDIAPASPGPSGSSARAEAAPPAPSRRALLREPGFWTIAAPFAIALLAQVGFIVHQVAFLEPIIGRSLAGLAVTATATMALIGRLCLGLFVDRIDPRLASVASLASQAIALSILLQTSNVTTVIFACALYGFSIGNLITLPPLIIQREFGLSAFTTVLGLSTSLGGIISAFGPGVLGVVRSFTGGYTAALVLCLVLKLIAAVLVLLRPQGRVSAELG